MFEMAMLDPSKETGNKLRWSTYVERDKTHFQLYIPKWRVPEPWPGRIIVSIGRLEGDPSGYSESRRPLTTEVPIDVVLEPVEEHTRTFRYSPTGDPVDWPTGEPYIPFSLIPPDSQLLLLRVEWDLDSLGMFVNVPTYRGD